MGARVSVQDRETYPLMEEYGVDLAPGTLTSLSLQMVKITRHKYSGCQATNWEESQYGEQLSDQHKSDYRQVGVGWVGPVSTHKVGPTTLMSLKAPTLF